MNTQLQNALNKYISLDPESTKQLQKLKGKVVTIALTSQGPQEEDDNSNLFLFQLIFTETNIELNSSDLINADTTIRGTPLTLLNMSANKSDRKKFFADDVSIDGNIELGQQVIELFDTLEIDWEEYLSHWVGDIAAHKLASIGKKIQGLGQRISETFMQNVNEYVHEEVDLFPTKEALKDLFQDIDTFRMDADRLELRIKKLIEVEEEPA